MTKEEVIKLLQEELERCQRAPELNGCEMKPEWQRTMDVCRVAVEAIREQEQRRWIPVTERLPQNYISVLVYLPGERPLPTVHEAYIGGDGNWHSSVVYGVENADVTHWMPLPEPTKEESKPLKTAEWKVFGEDTPQCTHCGMWMPFARYRRGQGTDARSITDFCPNCGRKMNAMPMCESCTYGNGEWKDDGICYACREQVWIPGKPHRQAGTEHI